MSLANKPSFRKPLNEMTQRSSQARKVRAEINAAQQNPEPDVVLFANLVINSLEVHKKRANGYSWERSCYRKTPDLKVIVKAYWAGNRRVRFLNIAGLLLCRA